MEPVDNDLSVGQESPGDVSEASVHVHDDVLHFVPVGEGAKIFLNGQGGSVRQDVEHAAIQRVCDDTLKGLAARVALEFVKGDGLGSIPKFCVNSQRGENRSEFNVRGCGSIRLPLVCSITPAGVDVKGGGKAAVHRSAVQRRADP